MNESIVFIGGGNMASALLEGLLQSGWPRDGVAVIERDADQCARLAKRFEVRSFASYDDAHVNPRVVVWAVKPQVLQAVALQLSHLMPGALHVSIAAGIETADLCFWFGTQRVVRAMPNTAAMVQSGVTGMCAAPGATAEDRLLAERIMQGTGIVFWVDSDERMDAVTAVSGSGPAYVFHFMEGLQRAASALGFDEALAKELTVRVVEGAVRQTLASREPLSTLRERVTSKGGTTAAALEVLDRRDTQGATMAALRAAYTRAGELAAELGRGGASRS